MSLPLFFYGCSDNKDHQQTVAPAGLDNAFPETIVLTEKPQHAVSVAEALSTIVKGAEIAVSGVIVGKNSFDKNLSIFSMTEKSVSAAPCPSSTCGSCPTSGKTVLVQYKDKSGAVGRKSFENFRGLRENAEVIVSGTADEVSTPNHLVINLNGFYLIHQD